MRAGGAGYRLVSRFETDPVIGVGYFRYFLHDCRSLVTNVRNTGNYSAESQVETQARYYNK